MVSFYALLVVVAAAFLSGCPVTQSQKISTIDPCPTPPPFTEFIQSDIEKYRALTGKGRDVKTRADAHMTLAVLYSHYNNPKPDYARAAENIEAYAELDPEGAKLPETAYRLSILRELNRITSKGAMQKEIKALSSDNEKLKAEISRLKVENQNLTEIIEKLKRLDQDIERKRTNFK